MPDPPRVRGSLESSPDPGPQKLLCKAKRARLGKGARGHSPAAPRLGGLVGPGGAHASASLRPPGSRLRVPPQGPKTAGATAPVAAAACSWRARAATAASSTSTVGCLGLPRRQRWAPARPPSRPPRLEPQQLRRPGPTRPDPRSQDRGTRRFLLRRKIRPDLRPPPPKTPVSSRRTAPLRRREDAQTKRA